MTEKNKKTKVLPDKFLLITENSKEEVSIVTATKISKDTGLDLVLVSEDPPVVKLMDYKKHLYKLKKNKKTVKTLDLKEVKFKPNTDEHDLGFKIKQIKEFLQEGHKVKLTIFHKGRQNALPQIGQNQMTKILSNLEYTEVKAPLMEGKKLSIVISPKQ